MQPIRSFKRSLFTVVVKLAMLASAVAAQVPTMTSLSPDRGVAGMTVTITGSNFDRDKNGSPWTGAVPYFVKFVLSDFGGEVVPTYVSPTTIRVVVPVLAVTGQLKIVQSTTVSTGPIFTVIKPPRIDSFSPSSGPVGTTVAIGGVNFDRDINGNVWTGSVPYRVRFAKSNGFVDVVPTFVSSFQIKAVVPAGAITAKLRVVQGGILISKSAATFTVTVTILRIVNNTQYDMISLTLNNGQKFAAGSGVPAQSTFDLTGVIAGPTTVVAGVGFYRADLSRDVWFEFPPRTVNIVADATTITIFGEITVGGLLTQGVASRNWIGTFFDNNGALHQAKFRFGSNGSWTFFVDGVQQGTGFVTKISWPLRSSKVTFQIAAGLPNVTISHPFGSFLFQNGPPNWPIIQYVKQ